nr:hypothetical protein [Tanacetum cinerariifolium]
MLKLIFEKVDGTKDQIPGPLIRPISIMNIDELKQKLLYKSFELEATNEEIKRSSKSMKQMSQLLEVACQERDEARDQLQNLLNMILKHSNDQETFNATSPLTPNCFVGDQHHQGPLMIPTKANSCIMESNSLSEAYNHRSSHVFDPIPSPEFSNINVKTPYVQDYTQISGISITLNGSSNIPKVDKATMVMEHMIKGEARARIVFTLSEEDTPVEVSIASLSRTTITTVTVKDGATELCSFFGDISGRFNITRFSDVMPTDMIPEPSPIKNPMVCGVAKEAGNTMFPFISPFSSSTTITNF